MKYEYWLALIKGIPAEKKCLLRKHMKTAEMIYYMEDTQLRKMEFLNEKEQNTIMQAKKMKCLEDEYERLCEKKIQFVPWFSRKYPGRLLEIPDFPYALYVKGSLPDRNSRKAAIVGARRCTPYGEKYAADFARALARCGVEIISGMARGVDGMGHRGALLGGGRTYAVLGSGVDVCYPKEHIGLYTDILEHGGGILSEQPPGTPPFSQNFPARNRIISGLADTVLVMEAGRRSGSLITVDLALEQGRDVYALPGPVNSLMSDGCNRLIRQGAGILLSPEELLEELDLIPDGGACGGKTGDDRKGKKTDKNEKMLESPEKLVYSCLGFYPKGTDQLISDTGLSAKELMELLVSLELQGFAREISKNHYIRAEGSDR